MKKILSILLLLPTFMFAQQWVRTAHGSEIWMVSSNGVDSFKLPSYDLTGNTFYPVLSVGTTAVTAPVTVANFASTFPTPQTGTMLHLVSDASVNGRVSFDNYNNISIVGPNYQGRRARGTAAAPTAAIADDILVTIGGDGYGDNAFHNISVASITMRSEGTMTNTSAPTYMTFATTPTGTITNTERMRINSNGSIRFHAYGTGTNTGTQAYGLGVDASGNIIETTQAADSYSINVMALTSSPADAQTTYFGMLPKAPTTTANISKVYFRTSGTINVAEIYCYAGTAGTAEAWSLYIRKNNTTDYLIKTVSSATNERVFNNAAMNIPITAGDYIEIKSVQPTWATNPLTTIYGGYIKLN